MNYFSVKKGQINLEKLIKRAEDISLKSYLLNKNKIYEEKKDKKIYLPQESKFNLKQINKIYNINRDDNNINGFSKEYINLFTDLLYENNPINYSKIRLSLINFRKKILKKKLSISFDDFMEKENSPKNNETNNLKTIYSSKYNKKLRNAIFKNSDKNNSINKIHLTLSQRKISSFNIKIKNQLKLNFDIINNNKNEEKQEKPYKSLSKKNFHLPFTGLDKNKLKTINCYNLKKFEEDDKKYMWESSPEDDYIQRNNKIRFIDYLKTQYNFYRNKSHKAMRNIEEQRKRQKLFNNDKIKIMKSVEFPYKKEFFSKFNRLMFGEKNKDLLIKKKTKKINL